MPEEKSLAEVLEDHRRERGADEVRVSLAPGADPKTVAQDVEYALEFVKREEARYYAFSELERSQAYAARLKGLLNKIHSLTNVGLHASETELRERLSDISLATDLIFDINFEEDIAFMEAAREKAAAAGH